MGLGSERIFAVIGSVGAVILGMMLGFKIVILLAALVYLAALFLIPSKQRFEVFNAANMRIAKSAADK